MSQPSSTDRLIVVEHPVAAEALTLMRDPESSPPLFRETLRRLSRLLAVRATEDLPWSTRPIITPTGKEATGIHVDGNIIIVPVLRAGLGMIDGFLDILPKAQVGFLGLARNEETLQPEEYYRNFPDTTDAQVFVLDPMLATGGSACAALESLKDIAPSHIRILSVISAPEGITAVHSLFPDVTVFTAAVDDKLDHRGFILPGLGDAGDRLWGTE